MIKDNFKALRYYVLIIWLFIIFLGYLLYKWSTNTILYEERIQISQIADATVKTILQWRTDRLADARSLSQSVYFSSLAQEILNNPTSVASQNKMRDLFRLLPVNHHYEDIFLLKKTGEVVVSHKRNGTLYPNTVELATRCYNTGKLIESDFYYCSKHNEIHYDLLAPIRDSKGSTIGIVLLRTDPSEYFYDNLTSYGSHFESSEVLLGKKVGKKIHILNPLKSISNDKLTLEIDQSEKESPIIQASLGKEGIVEGVNYREEEVFAYVTKIPTSDWLLSVQVNKAEIKKSFIFRVGVAFGVTVMIMSVIFLVIAFKSSRESNRLLKNLFEDEKTIRLQNEKYKSVILGISEGVIITDHEGRIASMNKVAEDLTGRKESRAIGKQIELVCPLQELGSTIISEHPLRALLNGNVIESQEKIYQLNSINDVAISVSISAVKISDEDQISGAALIIRDKTQEFETIKNMYLSERRLQQGEALARTGYWEINSADMIYHVSEGTKKIVGIEKSQIPYQEFLGLIHPDDLQRVLDRHAKIGTELNSDTYEFRIIHPDTHNTIHILTMAELEPNGSKVFGVIQDITEDKIIAEEQQLNLLVNEALLKMNTSNIESSEVFGLAIQLGAKIVPYDIVYFYNFNIEEENYELKDFYHHANFEIDKSGFQKSDLATTAFLESIVENPAPLVINNERNLQSRIKPLYCPDDCKNLLAFSLNISDSKPAVLLFLANNDFTVKQQNHIERLFQGALFVFDRLVKDAQLQIYAERLKQSNDTKDKFVSILAHDLRNPFHAMIGVVDTLESGIHDMPTDDIVRYVRILSQSVYNQYNLLNELLDWSKIHSDNFVFLPVPIHVLEEIRSVVNSLLLSVSQKRIELTTNIEEDIVVEADANMFRLMIRNLLSNAIKFTHTGGRIIINAKKNPSDFTLELIDSGVGISQLDIEKILNTHVRFTTVGTNSEKGTGLGMQFVQEIITKHNGQLEIESAEGIGSKFIIKLPIKHKII